MKRYKLILIIMSMLWFFSDSGCEAMVISSLLIRDGAAVTLNNSTVDLNCLNLVIETGGTLNLGTGAINHIGEMTIEGQLNNRDTGRISTDNCFKLIVLKKGDGTGVVTSVPTRIDCGGDCESYFVTDSSILLSAAPDTGSAFDGWFLRESEVFPGCPGNGDCTMTHDQEHTITADFNPDGDNDGISDNIENAGPNNGDGNLNGLKDSLESNVATFKSIECGYMTLITENGTTLSQTSFEGTPSGANQPSGYYIPECFTGFTVQGFDPGSSALVTLILHEYTYNADTYVKYGPTPQNTSDHWYEFNYDGLIGARFFKKSDRTVIDLYLKDGSRGDDDLEENGSATDIGVPANKGTRGGGSDSGCFISTVKGDS